MVKQNRSVIGKLNRSDFYKLYHYDRNLDFIFISYGTAHNNISIIASPYWVKNQKIGLPRQPLNV